MYWVLGTSLYSYEYVRKAGSAFIHEPPVPGKPENHQFSGMRHQNTKSRKRFFFSYFFSRRRRFHSGLIRLFNNQKMVKVSKVTTKKSKKNQEDYAEAVESPPPDSSERSEEEEEEDSKKSDSDEESNEDSESEEEGDVTAIFKGISVPEEGSSEDNSDDESSDEADDTENMVPFHNTAKGTEACTFDLRNMLAVNSHQLASNSLYMNKQSKEEEDVTIPLDKDHGLNVNEDFLLAKASSGCAQLVRALWQLPTDISDAGPLITLPGYDEIKIPRALVSSHSRYLNQPPYSNCIATLTKCCPHFSLATAATERRDKMGKVCQSKGNSSQQRKTFAQGLGRDYR